MDRHATYASRQSSLDPGPDRRASARDDFLAPAPAGWFFLHASLKARRLLTPPLSGFCDCEKNVLSVRFRYGVARDQPSGLGCGSYVLVSGFIGLGFFGLASFSQRELYYAP